LIDPAAACRDEHRAQESQPQLGEGENGQTAADAERDDPAGNPQSQHRTRDTGGDAAGNAKRGDEVVRLSRRDGSPRTGRPDRELQLGGLGRLLDFRPGRFGWLPSPARPSCGRARSCHDSCLLCS
jgi:hypothetical protein